MSYWFPQQLMRHASNRSHCFAPTLKMVCNSQGPVQFYIMPYPLLYLTDMRWGYVIMYNWTGPLWCNLHKSSIWGRLGNQDKSNSQCCVVIVGHPLIETLITKTCPCDKQQIFHGCKKDNFQMKNCDVFLIFAQNIDCGYTLEPPQ